MNSEESLQSRLQRVQERIALAAERSGRSADDVTLVAVSKFQPPEAVMEAHKAGVCDFGENYVQEAQAKHGLPMTPPPRWHMLGHLQSNKVHAAVDTFELIQSVDSVRLATKIGATAQAQGRSQSILLQVRLGDEQTKFGLAPALILGAAAEIRQMPGVTLLGLMGIASQTDDARLQFQALYGLYQALPGDVRRVLSMGMTGDFEVAIEEGATMVRIGTALFGARRQ